MKEQLLVMAQQAKTKSRQERKSLDWNGLTDDFIEWLVENSAGIWKAGLFPSLNLLFTEIPSAVNDSIDIAGVFGSFSQRPINAESFWQNYSPPFIAGQDDTTIQGIKDLIAEGLANGWSNDKIIQQLGMMFDLWMDEGSTSGWLSERTPYNRREMISRSETIRASNAGLEETYQSYGLSAKQWFTAADPCEFCAELDGKIIDIDQNFFAQGDVFTIGEGDAAQSITLDYEDVGYPPLHVNCLLPGTEVVLPGPLVAAAKSLYVGPCIEVSLANGRRLAVTANHPILTTKGWLPAQSISQGDEVISALNGKGFGCIDPYDDQSPVMIEQIFTAFVKMGSVLAARVPASTVDFHGDGRFIKDDVHVVYVDRRLLSDLAPALSEPVSEQRFIGRDMALVSLARDGAPSFLGSSNGATPRGIMGWMHKIVTALLIKPGPPTAHTAALVSNGNASFHQATAQDIAADSRLIAQRLFRLTGDVARDNVVQVGQVDTTATNHTRSADVAQENLVADAGLAGEFCRRFSGHVSAQPVVGVRQFDFAGHVYNLQVEPYSLFFANSIITSNCRCVILPVIVDVDIPIVHRPNWEQVPA